MLYSRSVCLRQTCSVGFLRPGEGLLHDMECDLHEVFEADYLILSVNFLMGDVFMCMLVDASLIYTIRKWELSATLLILKINSIIKCLPVGVRGSLYVDVFCICFRSKS